MYVSLIWVHFVLKDIKETLKTEVVISYEWVKKCASAIRQSTQTCLNFNSWIDPVLDFYVPQYAKLNIQIINSPKK